MLEYKGINSTTDMIIGTNGYYNLNINRIIHSTSPPITINRDYKSY